MPKIIKPLSDTQVRNAKPKEKDYKLSDGGGMYVIIKKTGAKWWRLNYLYNKKQKTISLGVYPEVSLLEAREQREYYKKALKDGDDPSEIKRLDDQGTVKYTFKKVAEDWYSLNEERFSSSYRQSVTGYLNNHIYPYIQDNNIETLTTLDIINLCKIMEQKNILETLRRTLSR